MFRKLLALIAAAYLQLTVIYLIEQRNLSDTPFFCKPQTPEGAYENY